jgi:alpha-2-macroglobulin
MKRGGVWLLALVMATLCLTGTVVYLINAQTPAGWLRGTAVAQRTGAPLGGIAINLHLLGAASDEMDSDYVLHTRADGSFGIKRLPAGTYQLQATSEAHALRATKLVIEEGKVQEANLELAPIPPFFSLIVNQHIFTPDETPQIMSRGFLPGMDLTFLIYRVNINHLIQKSGGDLRTMIYSDSPSEHLRLEGNPGLSLWKQFDAPITKRDAEGVFRQRFDLPSREPGMYLVVARTDKLQELAWIAVTRLGLITKQWGDQALGYVSDIKTGAPVAGAQVTFSAGNGGSPVVGTTDKEGLCQLRVPPAKTGADTHGSTLLAFAEKDGSVAFLTNTSWRDQSTEQDRIYAYTDRPVYRPGHSVYFKGIGRRWTDQENYAVLSGKPVEVRVLDPRDTLVFRSNFTSNQFGSFNGAFRLNEEAATGEYRLISNVNGEEHQTTFTVAEYRKPEYSVDVTTEKKRYTKGERIEAKVSAQYYFGAPVAGAEVSYLVYRSPYWAMPNEEADASDSEHQGEEYEGSYGEVVEQGTARTDASGAAHFSITTKPPVNLKEKSEQEEEPQDYEYSIEATVTDPSQKEATGQGTVLVTQGEFLLDLETDSYVTTPETPTSITITARDYDGRPVKGQRVEVMVQPQVWNGREMQSETSAKGTVTTDARGKATYRFTPRAMGDYRIRAQAWDRGGNRIQGSTYLWVTSEEYADFSTPYPALEIIADKKSYRRGDTAVILINSKYKGATALVTTEGSRLYEHQLVELKGNSTRVTLPIRQEYMPNFFVSVALVRNKEFVNESKRLKVSLQERQLQVEIKPDRTLYKPGDEAHYEIVTKDHTGKPLSAEVSIGVVDESVYAVQEETTPPMLGFFYPARENLVDTAYSFPQIYLDAEKGATGIKVRRKFPDTAFWNPTVVTDAQGKATVSFEIPDTLTTWRATVRAATLNTDVGEAVNKVKCSKELLVRLEAPRFAVQNDQFELAALVHNYSGAEQQAEAWLQATGLKFIDTVQPTRSNTEKFRLKDGGMQRIAQQTMVPMAGNAEITAYTRAGRLSDAMALNLPTLPHGRLDTQWRRGALNNDKPVTERLTLRQDAIDRASDIRVRLAPSMASVILGALDYLAEYPYGCTEQTMSAFLPDVIVARALKELGLKNDRLEKQLPDMVHKGLFRLYGFQHDDGGWGWWRYDESQEWMTAYVIFGLLTAQQNNYVVNETTLNNGVRWLRQEVKKPVQPYGQRDRVYALYVLSLLGKDDDVDNRIMALYNQLQTQDAYELALLTAALSARGKTREANTAAQALWRKATETPDLVFWKNSDGWWGRAGDIETTALALRTLYAMDPKDDRIGKIIRWLTLGREANHWISTRDTAFTLFALTDYLKNSGELHPDYTAVVALNGKTLLTRKFTATDLLQPEVEIKAAGKQLARGDNRLTITKQGGGVLYYTATLRQYLYKEDLPALTTGAGITVRREYYKLVSSRNVRTGVITILPSPNPTTDFKSGESILVRLTINTPKPYDYVVIEDPLPAGCEVTERGDLESWEWDFWWADMEARDEKVAFFARTLRQGKSVLEYHLRPQIAGDYHVMPTNVESMYNPEVRGSGAETRVRLR